MIMRATAGFGALLVLATFAGLGSHAGVGALFGVLVSLANFAALTFLASRIFAGGARRQTAMVGLLMLKLGLLAAVCFALIVLLGVDGLGFAIGCSALVVAVFTTSLLNAPTGTVGGES
jgi:hypothetical protein